jgi:hypothetical protein
MHLSRAVVALVAAAFWYFSTYISAHKSSCPQTAMGCLLRYFTGFTNCRFEIGVEAEAESRPDTSFSNLPCLLAAVNAVIT